MRKRVIFSVAFVVGGMFTLLLMLIAHGFGEAGAGMSVGPVSPSGPPDLLLIALGCSYFFGSAFGIYVVRAKSALWIWAFAVHILIIIGWGIIFVSKKNGDPDGYKWPDEMLTLSVVMMLYFLPWVAAWGSILFGKTHYPTN